MNLIAILNKDIPIPELLSHLVRLLTGFRTQYHGQLTVEVFWGNSLLVHSLRRLSNTLSNTTHPEILFSSIDSDQAVCFGAEKIDPKLYDLLLKQGQQLIDCENVRTHIIKHQAIEEPLPTHDQQILLVINSQIALAQIINGLVRCTLEIENGIHRHLLEFQMPPQNEGNFPIYIGMLRIREAKTKPLYTLMFNAEQATALATHTITHRGTLATILATGSSEHIEVVFPNLLLKECALLLRKHALTPSAYSSRISNYTHKLFPLPQLNALSINAQPDAQDDESIHAYCADHRWL